MTTMKIRAFVLCAFLLYPAAGIAQDITMADLKDAQKLSGDELRQLLTGAKVKHMTRYGSTRYWSNNPDGKFTASGNAQGYKGRPTTYPAQGAGSWHISPLDQYCVTIEWKAVSENWCLFVYKAGDRFYGSTSQNDPAVRAIEFWFSK